MGVVSPNENVEENFEKQIGKRPKSLFGIRHLQVVLVFLATVLVFSMKAYMSMAIVAMTTESPNSNATVYSWDTVTQSHILSSLNWGFIMLQIPGGMIATRYGSKLLCTVVILINGVVSLLIPISAEWFGWQGVCVCRAIQGLSQGLFLPVGHVILAKWVPLQEKGFLCTLAFGGVQMGMGTSILISGLLASTSWGWPSIFYFYGVVCLAWLVFWLCLAADTPETSKWMSEEERNYILCSTGKDEKALPTPWRSLLTSVPFWALALDQCGHNWGFWILLTQIPTYMKTVLGIDLRTNGIMTALPYIAMYSMSFPVGFLSDFIIAKGASVTATRKIFNTIGHWGPALVLIGLSYAPVGDVAVAVGFLVLIMGLKAGTFAGYLLVHIDLAPNFAGILMGIGSFLGSISAVAAPMSVGFIRTKEEKLSEWQTIFFITAAFYFMGNLVFLLFGSSEKQPWNEPTINGDIEKSDALKSVRREDQSQTLEL